MAKLEADIRLLEDGDIKNIQEQIRREDMNIFRTGKCICDTEAPSGQRL